MDSPTGSESRNVSSKDFADLMTRVRMGSDEAVEEMLLLCRPQIFRIVRRRLGNELRSQYDSEDFVQSMWQAFFEHRSRILQFTHPGSLIAFLSQIASNKVVDACRKRLSSNGENRKREPLLHEMMLGSQDLTCETPTPSDVAIKNEDWDQLVGGKPDRHRRMLVLRANGARISEIAAELNVSERTVRRVFEKLKRRQK